MENRDNIKSKAIRLFSLKGYDSVGVQEIVDACSVKKPTLYHYFKSKYGLLETILKEDFGLLVDMVKSSAEYHRDITKNLTDITKTCFGFAMENKELYRMILTMYISPPDNEVHCISNDYYKKMKNIIEELFLKATEDHGNMRDREAVYSATFLGLINTYIGLYLNGYIEFNEHLIYRIVHQFMHGIFS